jgi:predicted phosphodiesterase
MKIVIFSDVHGSLNALNKLIETEDFKTADKRVFLGDVVFGCSRPLECLKLISNYNCDCVIGNNDYYISHDVPNYDFEIFDEQKKIQLSWMRNAIDEEGKNILNSWKNELEFNINNISFHFSHYAYTSDGITTQDPPVPLDLNGRKEMFKNTNNDYYFFGHEHNSNYFYDDKKHFYCVGTLGLRSPGCYVVVSIEDEVRIEEKYIEFDIDEEIKLMDIAGYPYAKNKIKI